MIITSKFTCPKCGFKQVLEMPVDQCQVVYQCPRCRNLIVPKQGDDCIFCSYGNTPCPDKQITDRS
ncbi:MAG: GDCCVxC domain-containing (seleno)protein [Planctomycetota bacterium]